MKKSWFYLLLLLFLPNCIQSQKKHSIMDKFNKLTPEEEYVILRKGTERPFTGKYVHHKEKGLYLCRQCNAPLYRSSDKFESECGWPSFDDEIPGAVRHLPDADGHRTEIVCGKCDGHLGHVFEGEGFTSKNTRHCVNSVSLDFVQADTAYFASGCFWGTEFYFEKANGVITTDVGYMGGHVEHPTYKEVCTGTTGHVEATQVVYSPKETSYEDMVKLFFETHDFTQTNGQGPDIGPQYHSVLFYEGEEQHAIAKKYMEILRQKGYQVATRLQPVSDFWRAEEYHQNYYTHKNGTPYCHIYRKIF